MAEMTAKDLPLCKCCGATLRGYKERRTLDSEASSGSRLLLIQSLQQHFGGSKSTEEVLDLLRVDPSGRNHVYVCRGTCFRALESGVRLEQKIAELTDELSKVRLDN